MRVGWDGRSVLELRHEVLHMDIGHVRQLSLEHVRGGEWMNGRRATWFDIDAAAKSNVAT